MCSEVLWQPIISSIVLKTQRLGAHHIWQAPRLLKFMNARAFFKQKCASCVLTEAIVMREYLVLLLLNKKMQTGWTIMSRICSPLNLQGRD